jgi:hypothetical protein
MEMIGEKMLVIEGKIHQKFRINFWSHGHGCNTIGNHTERNIHINASLKSESPGLCPGNI